MSAPSDRGSTGRLWSAATIAGGALLAASCIPLSNGNYRTLEAYLSAEEFEAGRQGKVVSLGQDFWKGRSATDYLLAALGGPTPAGVANLQSRYSHSYRRLASPAIAESVYVRYFLENTVAVYRARAAAALGAIGSERASDSLSAVLAADSAGDLRLREDLRRALHRAIVVANTSEFLGTVWPSAGAVLDTISLASSGRPFDGDEKIRLVGGPFPNDVMVDSAGPILRFVLAAPLGSYNALVEDEATGESWRVPVAARRINYAPAGPANAYEIGSHPSPERIYSVLSGAVDTADGRVIKGTPVSHFRLRPRGDSNVLATVEWRGAGWVDASWTACEPPAPSIGSLRGVILDRLSRPIAGAAIRFDGVSAASISDSLGRFVLMTANVAEPFRVVVSYPGTSATRTIEFPSAPAGEVTLWRSSPVLAPTGGASASTSPYRLNVDSAAVTVRADSCRLLKIQKLDRETEYVVTQVSVRLRP